MVTLLALVLIALVLRNISLIMRCWCKVPMFVRQALAEVLWFKYRQISAGSSCMRFAGPIVCGLRFQHRSISIQKVKAIGCLVEHSRWQAAS